MKEPREAGRSPARRSPKSGSGVSQGEAAYFAFREKIIRLEFTPGQILSEAKLVTLLTAGPGPVRYAIQRLAGQRLLRVVPRGHTLVTPLAISEVAQSYAVRTSLEVLASRRAANQVLLSYLDRMTALVEQAELALRADDFQQATDFSRKFFAELVVAAQNQILEEVIQGVHGATERFEYFLARKLNRSMVNIQAMNDLIDAMRRRDPDGAQSVVEKQLGSQRWQCVAELLDISLVMVE
jgi:DNA-binding GntR family transcriptional regulator